MGPIALFDKSFVQSLSQNEAVWFDHFFLCNIAPSFLIETLADLKKAPRKGRTAPQLVQEIASKSPEHGCPGVNTFHRQAVAGSILGYEIPMTGQVLTSGGKRVKVDGKVSTIVEDTPEAEAFRRWQDGQFLELEHRVAAKWSEILETKPDVATAMKYIRAAGLNFSKCKALADVKQVIDAAIRGGIPTDKLLNLALFLQNIGEPVQTQAQERQRKMSIVAMAFFAPYAAHVLAVDVFMYAGMSLKLISDSDPHTKTDFSYLYYLPFCMLFVSSDKIHQVCTPFFLRKDQKFIWGPELKAALKEIDEHYLRAIPEEQKAKGVFSFAQRPPQTAGGLVAELWREFLRPGIMDEDGTSKQPRDVAESKKMVEELKSFVKKAKEAPAIDHDGDDESFVIRRKVRGTRGSWRILSREVEDQADPEA